MVLCFLTMVIGMTTLFFCNADSMTGKVGNRRRGLTRRRWVFEHLVTTYGCSMCYITVIISSYENI